MSTSATLHTPERLPNESFEQYRNRRAAAKRAHDRMTKPPRQAPATSPTDVSRFWLGQHTNPARRRGALPARDLGQHPKFTNPRKHKQHAHKLRDDVGAFTLVGRKTAANGEEIRRKWLAGISAHRGY